ncbi:MAG: hypothetical protein MMC33_007137 [Icmadophila ericetorum]|nr:hypothetical protein [Icmadophila ericetorum]
MASAPIPPPAGEPSAKAFAAKEESVTDLINSPLDVDSLSPSPPLDSYKTPLSSSLGLPNREPTDYPLPLSPTEPVQSTSPFSDKESDAANVLSSSNALPVEQPTTVRSSVLDFVKSFLPDLSTATKVSEPELESKLLETTEPKEFDSVKTASPKVTSPQAPKAQSPTKEVTKSPDTVEPLSQMSEKTEPMKKIEQSPNITRVSNIRVVHDIVQPSKDTTIMTSTTSGPEAVSLMPDFSFGFDTPKEDTSKATAEHLESTPETTKVSQEPKPTILRSQTAPIPSRRSSVTSSPSSPTPLKSSAPNEKMPQPSQSPGCFASLFSCFGSSKSQSDSPLEGPRPVSKPALSPAPAPVPAPLKRSHTSVIASQRGTGRQLPNLLAQEERSAPSSSKDSTPRNSANEKQRLHNIDEKESKITRQYTNSVDSIEELKEIKALQRDIEKQIPMQKLSTRDRKELGVDEDTMMNFYI